METGSMQFKLRQMTAFGRVDHSPLMADYRRCLRILEWRLLIFRLAQAAASMAEGQQTSVPIQSLLMQIDADAVCLVRTQFQQLITMALPTLGSRLPADLLRWLVFPHPSERWMPNASVRRPFNEAYLRDGGRLYPSLAALGALAPAALGGCIVGIECGFRDFELLQRS